MSSIIITNSLMPHAQIATKQALHTLNLLHAELAGKVQTNAEERQRLEESMRHVGAVIKLLEPGYSLRRIVVRRRAKNQWFRAEGNSKNIIASSDKLPVYPHLEPIEGFRLVGMGWARL